MYLESIRSRLLVILAAAVLAACATRPVQQQGQPGQSSMPPGGQQGQSQGQQQGQQGFPGQQQGQQGFPGQQQGQEGFPGQQQGQEGFPGQQQGQQGLPGQQQAGGSSAGGEGQGDETGGWPEGDGTVAGGGGTSGAEEIFNESLGDFDEIIGAEREQMAREGIGSAADEVFQDAGSVGGNPGSSSSPQESDTGRTGAESSQSTGGAVLEDSGFSNESPAVRVEGCEDEDKVARQLCEAATKEEDPFLRAALWDEYNEYKRILARQ